MSDSCQNLSAVHQWVAIVPMRSGSKGLPSKNVRQLGGMPLYQHSVRVAQEAGASKIVLSTDIESVIQRGHSDTVFLVRRPAKLAGDLSPMDGVVAHVLSHEVGLEISDSTIVVLLQPTSPLRLPQDVHESIQLLVANDADLAMGVTAVDSGVLKYGQIVDGRFVPLSRPEYCFANRQSLPEVVRPNGAIYAFRAGWFRRNGGFETSRIAAVSMPEERSIDVDSVEDFERAEALLLKRREGAA